MIEEVVNIDGDVVTPTYIDGDIVTGGGTGTTENLSVELTKQDNLLTEQEMVIKQIIDALQAKMPESTIETVEEIEKLLVSYFETKTVKEVEE